jgi:transposase
MVEIFRGQARRRWSEADKRRLVAETMGPGATVHGVARRHGVSPSQLFAWRKLYRVGAGIERAVSAPEVPGFAAVEIAPATPPSVADVVPALSGLIEIELAGGDRVRISGAADPEVVVAALRSLAGR